MENIVLTTFTGTYIEAHMKIIRVRSSYGPYFPVFKLNMVIYSYLGI